MSLPDLDAALVTPDFAQDPYSVYRRLLEEDPVHWSEAWDAWLVSGYDDAVATLRDHETFSSSGRVLELLQGLPSEVRAAAEPIRRHFSTTGLVHADPPAHGRLRALVSRAFSARVIEGLRPRIQAIVDGLVDAVIERGAMDVVADLAYPLPATVIAELLGARPEDRDLFKGWSDGIVAFQGTGRALVDAVPRSATALVEMRAYIAEICEERRREPQEDLLSALVAVEDAGAGLTTEELYSTCVTFLIGGHETTTSLIANGLYLLLRHPDQLARLRAEPSLLASAIEECLRVESPIQRTFRRVAHDTRFRGRRLREGQIVIQLLGAANRDPARFERPDEFDIRRSPNRHIAFGSGVHFCIGAPLARLEASVALSTLLRRLPDLGLADEAVDWQTEKALFRCVRALPLRWSPRPDHALSASTP